MFESFLTLNLFHTNTRIVKLTVGPLQANCYLVYTNDVNRGVIVDPGYETKKILKMIEERNVSISFLKVSVILIPFFLIMI